MTFLDDGQIVSTKGRKVSEARNFLQKKVMKLKESQ